MASTSSTKPTTPFSTSQAQQPTPPPSRPVSQLSTSGLRYPSNRKTIYDRNLNRTRTAELSRASFAYLFAEMVSYAQKRVTGIQDLERRYLFLLLLLPSDQSSLLYTFRVVHRI